MQRLSESDRTNLKLPWKLFTDRPPGCSQCEKDGAKAIEIENGEGKVIFHWGHDTFIDDEFDFGVVEDGSAVIVISGNEQQERIGIKYTDSSTIAKRYESARQAVQILLKGNENNLHNDNYLLDSGK